MAKLIEFDYSEFRKFLNGLKLGQKDIDKRIEDFIYFIANRALDKMKEKTPVGVYSNSVHFKAFKVKAKGNGFNLGEYVNVDFETAQSKVGGNLRRNWRIVSVKKVNNKWVIELANNTEYAGWVNNGHRIVDKNKRTLGWVEGKFFVEIAMEEIEKELPIYVKKLQEDILKQMFGKQVISINDIRIAIQQALDNDYPNIEIYSESIEQGFEVPCFFVKLISSNQDKQLNNRYKQSLLFDVHYFSDKEEDLNKDCLDVADNLYRALEYVEIDGHKYRALKMNHKVTDGVLHFMLKFNYNILKVIEHNKMKELEVNVNGK